MKIIGYALALSLTLFSHPASGEDLKPVACSASEFRQFDFWLGKWTAYSREGKRQGSNHLHQVLGGCAMQENWSGGDGSYQGKSFNFYDRNSKHWHQTWVDNQGGHLKLKGAFNGTSMQLSGPQVTGSETIINKITWTPLEDGRVRQHWEVSKDEGKSWSTAFDGYYQRDES